MESSYLKNLIGYIFEKWLYFWNGKLKFEKIQISS